MNPADAALAQLDAILDEQAAAAPRAAPEEQQPTPAAITACPTRRRVGNPTNGAPASLPEAAAAALKRRREQQPAQQPTQLRCSKRVRGAPPVAEFAAGAEVEALWEGKWFPGVVAEVIVEQDVSYEVAWADSYYQNRIRAVSRSGEKLVRRRADMAAAPAVPHHRRLRCEPPLRAGDWHIGAHVEDANDSTVRGVVTDCPRGSREVTTTTGSVVMIKPSKLTQATLTPDEAARCVRPASKKDYFQARIDGAIRYSHDGREFQNRYTCADGTECRQFEVTATGVRCALCPDVRSWSLETDFLGLLGNLKKHCGGYSDTNQRPATLLHLERLLAAASPPVATSDEAGTVLGISHAQARQLEEAAAAGRLIPVRDRTSSPRPAALPSDAALEAMTGTQLRKLMARCGVGRGPQDRKEDFIDKLKARAAGETYVNKPNPYKRRAPTRRKLPAKSGGLCLGSRVWAFGKRGTITDLPAENGWWRVRLDGDSGTRGARAGDMRALDGAVAPPRPPPSANELKLREELARLKQENERRKAPRRSGRARPPDATVETKSDDDGANGELTQAAIGAEDEATAQERNRRLAEDIGAPVCLWGGADVWRERDEAMDPEAKRPRTEAPWARWDQSSENDSAAPRPAPPVLAAPAASAAPGRRGPEPPGPAPPTHGWRGRIRAAEAEFDAWAAHHAAARAREPAPAPLAPAKLRSLTMVTLEEAKRHVSTYAAEAELSKRRQRLNSLILLLECHLEDLQKRDKGDYYWSTLTASDLSVERIARESLFKWFESELLSGFEHDRRIKKLGYGFHGLCREVERRIRMLPTAPSPVMTTVAAPTPPPRPALPPSRIFERLRAGAAERFALRRKLIADGVPMASVEEQVSALYQRQKAAAEVAEAPAPDDLQAAVVPDGAAGVAPARLVAASTQSAPPPPRPPAPRAAPQCIDLTREDSDGSDSPTPPGDNGYSSSSSECSIESVGGQYVPQPPGPAPPNRTWDTRRGAWVDAAEEFDAWLAQHVPVARHAQLRDVADSLADLRCCDIDDIDDALELSQWPEPERRRFMDACSSL